ncbi:MATH and LRR domain-containing protein PFE0570w-like isoform X2 [Cydia pomonella]|uniref:MATH and LRR domain-containing protein PFE0570w-like isoform X2 n=1 Tax=Cydia pomonella TaxID=82600 RepID=UPI002ADDC525|nr:MATH and LRR domain-containing protein PFE0570w-like isoform X2 [Cydia pomonella]
MEEDVGVKVTVTRLRRRLSVEQSEDGGSPTPSTPTKKRGGRLAAKPQLELIEENDQVSRPRKTRRKSLATDAEEKPITPSRRSARIKSNSSIVSETLSVTGTDSPRAKRAARRNSQAGSDNDGPATPVRQTRRTRKDSTSSVEALGTISVPSPRCWPDIIGVAGPDEVILPLAAETSSHEETSTLIKPLPVAEMVIEEEPENEVQKIVNKSESSLSAADTEELSPNSARKSKRLLEKRNRRSGSYKTEQDSGTVENKSLNISTVNKEAQIESQDSPSNKSVKSKESTDDLSESNMSLLKKIETETKINKSNHNKSTSALDTAVNDTSKRTRTESWPAVTASVENNNISLSDNELSKKSKGKSSRNSSGFTVTDSPNIDKSNTSITEKNISHSFLDTSSKRKKKKGDANIENNSKPSEVLTPKKDSISNKDIASQKPDSGDVTRDMAKLFEDTPGNVQATVYFEDSDSNSVGAATFTKIEHLDSEDQCVPEVKHDFQEKMPPKELNENDNIILPNQVTIENVCAEISIPKIISDDVNNSCEPMDIDETIHEEILQKSLDITQQSNKSIKLSQNSIIEETNSSKRKSSISNSGVNTPNLSKDNKRKTSISNSGTNTPDLSKNDKRKSSISNSGVNTPDLSKEDKRKTSISNSGTNTPDLSKNDKRKSSISNSGVNTPDLSKEDKRKTSISNSGTNTPDLSKNDKRKSSISSSGTDTPDKTKNDKRKSSISNRTAHTPDLSKNNTNNKSTLILSQLKDISSTSDNVKSPKQATNEELSKSDITEKSHNKKISKDNLSLNDLKGTPKQNSIQKLTMQTSTPITTQQLGIKTKIEEQKQEGTKKNKSIFSKSMNETDSSEEDSDDDDSYERSVDKNKHIDDEAEEASDDYESGDSQDEEDRRYEEENKIVERGETLTSDDDMSNDTDYEKDSFVVSSDEEDNELLSGSGDDLSMSDNELTMSKKSKKKFNERKLKEQKNASRQMFESRHKLNSSDRKSPTPKPKKNRMRIDSSLLASDEEVVVNPNKSNRMRLDSTLNESAKMEDTNVSLNKSNKSKQALDSSERQIDTNVSLKKNKSMNESTCNKSSTDEQEITVCNDSTIYNADPLQVLVKQEPKTPLKDINISVVQLTDREEIENVQITEGNSIMNQTGTDPLQATMACDDTSDSSENEEILQNYDSVLNELNKDSKTKFNKKNISLNSDNTTKRNQVEPIIGQLNLTHTKKSKNNKDNMGDVLDSKTVKDSKEKQESENEDSSDSIDLQLLFSEDNCGSEDEEKSQQNKADDDSMFIPLKKSPGETNIRESIGMNASQLDTTLNETIKKKKNGKSSMGPAEAVDEPDTLNTSKNVNISMNESGKKKKKKHSMPEPAEEQSQDSLNISKNVNISLNESGKKKKKKHSLSEPAEEETHGIYYKDDYTLNNSKNVNVSMNESGIKKKKTHSMSEPAEEETQDTLNISKNVNVSMNESGIKKKKKHSASEPAEEETQDTLNVSKTVSISVNESGIKKKEKYSVSEPAQEDTKDNTLNISRNESGKKKKKHSVPEPPVEENQAPEAVDTEISEKMKKKKKHKSSLATEPESTDLFFIDTTGNLLDSKDECGELDNPLLNIVYNSKKKKKKNKLNIDRNETEQNENTIAESNPPVTPKNEKKKKKQKLEALVRDDDSDGAPDEAPYRSEKASEMDLQNIESVCESEDSAKKKHKKKKKKLASASNQSGENIASHSKKRKRKSSNADNSQESADVQESVEIGKHNELVGSNKKRKISHNEDNNTSGSSESKKAKKKKKKNRDVNFQDTASTSETTETQVKKNKKRKHRDDDGDNKQAKVKKNSSFQEVHVPRLPNSILRQLDDKPRKIEPPRVIATSNFIVENARQKRAKPSNYLEESIYLDEKSPLTKKQKQRIKNPKVLPFIPTASISDSGYTTNFKINKLSQTTRFEAEPVVFSKETYLQKNNIKRLGTYDRYKKQMHHKMSKF